MKTMLSPEVAAGFAALTLRCVAREYPHALTHVMAGSTPVQSPRVMHPVFYGCFDWHSCVHGYWQLARLRRLFPEMVLSKVIAARFDEYFTPANVMAEIRYFERAESQSFERPYGWAWLLELCSELRRDTGPAAQAWHAAIWPLAKLMGERFEGFLPKATYPIRVGTHTNTAFAMTLADAYARLHGDGNLVAQIEASVRRWYAADEDCQAWEPSLTEFLSPALMEAKCMATVLPAEEFRGWLSRFLPRLREGKPETLFVPATVSDRSDGHITHLDGLNLSRAWCFRGIATTCGEDEALQSRLNAAARVHLASALPHIEGDYVGEHWLPTFGLLAMSD